MTCENHKPSEVAMGLPCACPACWMCDRFTIARLCAPDVFGGLPDMREFTYERTSGPRGWGWMLVDR